MDLGQGEEDIGPGFGSLVEDNPAAESIDLSEAFDILLVESLISIGSFGAPVA